MSHRTMYWLRAVVVVGILAMIVAAVRLNEAEALDQQRTATYAQDYRSWIEKSAGCQRSKGDRRINRQGWTTARVRAQGIVDSPSSTASEKRTSRVAVSAYSLIVNDLSSRIDNLNCVTAYPPPPPEKGTARTPKGQPTIAEVTARLAAQEAQQRQVESRIVSERELVGTMP